MATLPDKKTTVSAIDEAVAAAVEPPRPHLGASIIGRPCDRALWYAFRWAGRAEHSGRLLRLFDRGRREEDNFASLLRMSGVRVILQDQATGQQFTYGDHGGHFGGSLDGIVQGLIESPAKWHVLECKTHSAKSFKDLVSKGVKDSKPEHWVQMQCYMHWSKIDRAYYLAVNKDDDQLYGERVRFDRDVALQALDRARRIISATTPPARMSEDPSWYQCKWCEFRALCHERKVAAVNCRTCLHVTPEQQGSARWSCAWHRIEDVPLHGQREGCVDHRFIPDLVPGAAVTDADTQRNAVSYVLPDGSAFANGPPGPASFSSAELAANSHSIAALLTPEAQAIRAAFS